MIYKHIKNYQQNKRLPREEKQHWNQFNNTISYVVVRASVQLRWKKKKKNLIISFAFSKKEE